MKFEVVEIVTGKSFKVWDNSNGNFITKDIPSKQIAQEIADDFNAMDNKDFRPIGGPNASNNKGN